MMESQVNTEIAVQSRDVPPSAIPQHIASYVRAADLHALNARRVVDPSDVVIVFEATTGGIAYMVVSTREDAADAADDEALRSALRQHPDGCLVLVLAADGSSWIERSALSLCNCGVRERWTC